MVHDELHSLLPKHPDEVDDLNPCRDYILANGAEGCWVEMPDPSGQTPGIALHVWLTENGVAVDFLVANDAEGYLGGMRASFDEIKELYEKLGPSDDVESYLVGFVSEQ